MLGAEGEAAPQKGGSRRWGTAEPEGQKGRGF
jgi:hypothetical protein